MRFLIIVSIFFLTSFSYSQDLKLGIEISPAWNLNAHHSQTTTSWSAENGYGFNIGFAMRYQMNEYTALNTGLNFEYVSFDNWAYNTLQSSLRFGSIHLPLILSKNVIGNWYGNYGGGVNFHLLNRYVVPGTNIDISSSIDKFQPYLAIGTSTLMDRNSGIFELGFLARYHFMELWDKNIPTVVAFSSHIIALDVILRFYL